MGSTPTPPLKMKMSSSVPCLLLVILLINLPGPGEATVAVTIGSLALTPTQVSALALLKVLGLKAGLLIGRARGRRETAAEENNVADLEDEVESLVNLVEEIQMEECIETLVCALNTKQVSLPSLRGLEKLLVARSPKFSLAKMFGASGKETKKCEKRYKCQLSVKNMAAALKAL